MIDLTIQDVCRALGVERHVVRRWLEGLPLFSTRPTKARSARRFDVMDVLTLSTVQELEVTYGLGLRTIARFSSSLHEALHGPRRGMRYLFLDFVRERCEPLGEHVPVSAGVVLDLEPAYRRVAAAFSVPTPFPELPFGTSPPLWERH